MTATRAAGLRQNFRDAARILVGVVLVSAWIFQVSQAGVPTTDNQNAPGQHVHVAEIRGSINPGSAAYLKHAVAVAERDTQTSAVLVELDTPGGLLTSTRDMVQTIAKSKVPVLIYVGPPGASATSAGAILMMGAHAAGMAPGTNIGAAHPVGAQGENVSSDLREKAVSDTVAMVKSLAQARKRPDDLAEKIVRFSKSYTSREAVESGLIDVVADTPEDFLKALQGRKVFVEGAGREVELGMNQPVLVRQLMSPGQRLLNFFADPNVATLLMSLGMLLIYVEITNPGITIAGVLGGICLIAGFMAFQLLPIRTGGLLLLVLGLAMLMAEAVANAHGALAAGGLISLVLGILWVMDPAGGALQISPQVWIPMVVVLGAVVLLLIWGAARSRKLVQQALLKLKGAGLSGLEGYSGLVEWVDHDDSRRGKAQFRGELWSVFFRGGDLRVGERVRVIQVEGFTVTVEKE